MTSRPWVLRHVGHAVPTELVGAFVSACIQVIRELTGEEKLETAFGWSLGLISRMLERAILEGATIVMKAVNQDSGRLLRKGGPCATWQMSRVDAEQHHSRLVHLSAVLVHRKWSAESGPGHHRRLAHCPS